MVGNCTSYTLTRSIEENIPFIVLNISLGIFICSENILTIVVVWKTPILRTVPNMYVVSLAVADLMVGIFAVPSQITFYIPSLHNLQHKNKHFCLFRHITFFVSVTTSICSMGVISLDRALYIGYPLRYKKLATLKKAKVIIACTWILSLVVSTVPAYYNNWNECGNCRLFQVIPAMYQVCVQIGLVVLVCIITASSYGFIFKIARSKHVCDRQPNSSRLKADMKLVKTFLMVFGLFVVCWAPVLILVILGQVTDININTFVFIAATLLSVFNSGLNFFVYVVNNRTFKRAIAQMICRTRPNSELICRTRRNDNFCTASINLLTDNARIAHSRF